MSLVVLQKVTDELRLKRVKERERPPWQVLWCPGRSLNVPVSLSASDGSRSRNNHCCTSLHYTHYTGDQDLFNLPYHTVLHLHSYFTKQLNHEFLCITEIQMGKATQTKKKRWVSQRAWQIFEGKNIQDEREQSVMRDWALSGGKDRWKQGQGETQGRQKKKRRREKRGERLGCNGSRLLAIEFLPLCRTGSVNWQATT